MACEMVSHLGLEYAREYGLPYETACGKAYVKVLEKALNLVCETAWHSDSVCDLAYVKLYG